MSLFNKVAIVGTGLIGGSLGLAIKKNHLAKQIVGVTRHKESLNLALKKRAIDKGSLNFEIIKGADLLILATPVDKIIELKDKVSKFISKDCIVMDVGSTKGEIVTLLERVFPKFVGTHPLAGLEKRGVKFATDKIFDHSTCIITPTRNTSKKAFKKICNFWRRLGTKAIILTPSEHDKVISFVSHLPHVIAFSLIHGIPTAYLGLAAGGLKDTTRIAASDPKLWRGIFLSNNTNILKAISLFEKELAKIKYAISRKDVLALEGFINTSKLKREKIK
jgi:prephenate dehydrogenase